MYLPEMAESLGLCLSAVPGKPRKHHWDHYDHNSPLLTPFSQTVEESYLIINVSEMENGKNHCPGMETTVRVWKPLYCTVWYCTALSGTVRHCTALSGTVRHCLVWYCTALSGLVRYCTVWSGPVLHCLVRYCTVLYCSVLYRTFFYCTGHSFRDFTTFRCFFRDFTTFRCFYVVFPGFPLFGPKSVFWTLPGPVPRRATLQVSPTVDTRDPYHGGTTYTARPPRTPYPGYPYPAHCRPPCLLLPLLPVSAAHRG